MKPIRAVFPLILAAGLTAGARNASLLVPCATPEFRQFDFFLGDWDAYDVADSTRVKARNRVTSVLDNCALREAYVGTDGLRGESLTSYDPVKGAWHQSWFTNRGELLLLNGGMQGGRMVLTATVTEAGGKTSLLRGTWYVEGETVRETADRSTDGGKRWKPVFDLRFRRHQA